MPASKIVGAQIVVRRNDLPTVPAALKDEAVKLVAQHAYQIQAAAQQKAPVRTGLLRRSIHTVFSNGGMSAVVGPSVVYGIFVEFGTRRMAARPYMRPAAELIFPKFVDAMKALCKGLGR